MKEMPPTAPIRRADHGLKSLQPAQTETIPKINYSLVVKDNVIDKVGRRFDSGVGPTAHHCWDISSEMCHPRVKPRKWILPLVTRFGGMPRV